MRFLRVILLGLKRSEDIHIQLSICKMTDYIEQQQKNRYCHIRIEIDGLSTKVVLILSQRTEDIEENHEPDGKIHMIPVQQAYHLKTEENKKSFIKGRDNSRATRVICFVDFWEELRSSSPQRIDIIGDNRSVIQRSCKVQLQKAV